MANVVWKGWRTSVEDAPLPITGIVFGANLRHDPQTNATPDDPQVTDGKVAPTEAPPNAGSPGEPPTG